jgi:hypothetical protein
MHLWSKSCKRRRRRFLKQNDEDEPGFVGVTSTLSIPKTLLYI